MEFENHRRIRLIDIAHRARVSYTAVAQVLRGSAGPRTKVSATTADRIRRVALELGYVAMHDEPVTTQEQAEG